MQIRGHFIRSVSRLGLPCPGTRSPRGWLPRLAAKLAGGTLGPWLPPRFGRPVLAVAPLVLG